MFGWKSSVCWKQENKGFAEFLYNARVNKSGGWVNISFYFSNLFSL